MIPIILGAPTAPVVKPVTIKETMNFSTGVTTNGHRRETTDDSTFFGIFNKARQRRPESQEHSSLAISIKRDLRTNNISIWFKFECSAFQNIVLKGIEINHTFFAIGKLSSYETAGDFYKLTEENVLTGDLSKIEKFSGAKFFFLDESDDSKTYSLDLNVQSHSNVEKQNVIDRGAGVDLQSISDMNFYFTFNDEFEIVLTFTHNLYNELLFKPIKRKKRLIKELYDVYSRQELTNGFNDYLNEGNTESNWMNPNNVGKSIDFHDGVFKGMLDNPKAEMKTIFANKINIEDWGDEFFKNGNFSTSDISGENAFKPIGTISINDFSYYDYKNKKTNVGIAPDSENGYIFPYNKNHDFSPYVKFSPNKAFKDISIHRTYNFERKMLDKNGGSVQLTIENPDTVSGKPIHDFSIGEENFERVIVNDFTISEMEKL